MAKVKAKYLLAEDETTGEEQQVQFIPPAPSEGDLGGISKEKLEQIDKLKEDLSNKITKFYASNQGETHLVDSDNGKIMDMMLYGKSSQDGTPTPDNPVEIKSVVNPTVKVTNEDGTQFETVTLPYTLNAIPVSSGGNVTINGQQYIADYVDVERGKLVRMCKYKKLLSADIRSVTSYKLIYIDVDEIWDAEDNYTYREFYMLCSVGIGKLITVANGGCGGKARIEMKNVSFTHVDEAKKYFDNNDVYACYPIPTPEEIPITMEEVSAFKQLLTYYPVTNISVNSEQLDGYTVFNYPISMTNGWNYVKQQLGDTRDYIYDMDAKAQDIDIQSAEAYVNSEYAVALTELEV